ncbi:3D domain-containing protein [Paenibacillus filicis]|uniref:3D domain-containing protein n=1 Tax=Paenibacillus filicis TaxID=669464 RepID=A0ABU9DU47_9BACL
MHGFTRWIMMVVFVFICITSAFALPVSAMEYSDNPEETIFINDFYIASDDPEPALPSEHEAAYADSVMIPSTIPYQVKSGDTLYRISRSFGVDVNDIQAANPLSDPNRLKIGTLLDIPLQKPALQLADGRQKVIKEVLSSTLTAYTAGFESTGKTPAHPQYGITYSGSKAEEGRTIAVDPKIIPIGTTVFIDGVGIRQAEDTGSAIRGSRIDVYMKNVDQALEFGVKKNVKVYVLSSETANSRS